MRRVSFKIIIFILALCSITYELILANTLAIITDNYIFWHSITIGIYILGLGFGSARSEKIPPNTESFIQVELNLSILGLISASYLYMLYGFFSINDFLQYVFNGYYTPQYLAAAKSSLVVFAILAESVTFFIGYFSGFEIPLGTELDAQKGHPNNENQILAINYIGTLAGTLLFSFIFYTKLDVLYTSYLIAGINLLIVFYLLIENKKINLRSSIKLFVIFVLAFTIIQRKDWIEQFYLKTNYLVDYYIAKEKVNIFNIVTKVKDMPRISRTKTKYQYIDIYKTHVPTQEAKASVVALNTHFQFSSHNEKFYHQAMAHIPINLLQMKPKKVLVLGGGDGLLLRELLKYKEMDITHIELDEGMINLCKTKKWIAEHNQGSLENPRIHRIIGDAFYYLRNTDQHYDMVYIDFPYPDNYNLVKLYTYEFYTYVKRALNKGGVAVLDAPMMNKINYLKPQFLYHSMLSSVFDADDFLYNTILYNTFLKAGYKFIFPYKIKRESFVILSEKEKDLYFDFEHFDHQRMQGLSQQDLYYIQEQDFPYTKDPSMANSLFRPTFLQAVSN